MKKLSRREFLVAISAAGASALTIGALARWARATMRSAAAARAAASGAAGTSAAVAKARATAVPELIERNRWPEHWETTLQGLGRSWITRNDRFFVRSHFPAPEIDPKAWRLEVGGLVRAPLTLTLEEVRALPTLDVTHTLECAGNGRALLPLPSTSGTQWERGAVGNATWTGVRLAVLLQRAGVAPEAKHVWLEAADQAPLPDVPRFLRSIPLEKALADTLLAHTMNGEPLSHLHGAPLRAIVPGWYGMASTKWLTRIRVEAAPSDNHFFVKGYRYVYPGEDPAQAPPVEELRVKSIITRPAAGERVAVGKVRVQGFAWAGPAGVRVVEISTDGGKTWRPAGFMGENAPMAWRAWATQIEVEAPATISVLARATDGNGAQQPLEARINAGGYGNNSIHKVTFHART